MQTRFANAYRIPLAVLASSALAVGQLTERVSVATGGAQANDSSGGYFVAISANGRFVAFRSSASNLCIGDSNGYEDIFVRDRQSLTTERVSVGPGGVETNYDCWGASISADGRFVAFFSFATNLVAGDTNGACDVFVRDRQSGTTERASVATGGTESDGGGRSPAISADGRFVAFESYATNLVAGDTNNFSDIFVRDRQSGTTERVSVDSGGAEANHDSFEPSISADGRFVAFRSLAVNLVAGDSNGTWDIFVHDRLSGTTERVSVDSSGNQSNNFSWHPSISADGQLVAFMSGASSLVTADTNGFQDIFVHDRQTGMTERASVGSTGTQADGQCDIPSISADGRFVAFQSDASNLGGGSTNGTGDVFVHDRQSGTTVCVSVDSNGVDGNSESRGPSTSADGRLVAFMSVASNLVGGDTNAVPDVFVRDSGVSDCNGNGIPDDLDIQSGSSTDCDGNGAPDECDLASGSASDCNTNTLLDSCEIAANPSLDLDDDGMIDRCQQAGTPYCFGDGSGHICPCDPGQAGTLGHGCANSSGDGAILSASGACRVTGDSLQLHIANMPNPSSVLFFQGTIQQNGGQGSFNGDGLLCVNGTGGSLIRLGAHGAQPGSSDFGAGIGYDPLISVRGTIPAAGGTRYYQAWYRDNSSYCTTAHYNFSNAITINWMP